MWRFGSYHAEVDVLFGVPQPVHVHLKSIPGCISCSLSITLQPTIIHWLCVLQHFTHDLGKGQHTPEEWPRHIGHEARSII